MGGGSFQILSLLPAENLIPAKVFLYDSSKNHLFFWGADIFAGALYTLVSISVFSGSE